MSSILLTFIGNNDRDPDESPGAIVSILRQKKFDRVYLLYNKGKCLEAGKRITRWCKKNLPDTKVQYQAALADNPEDYNLLYPAMYRAVKEILKKNRMAEYTISLTSGTPAMHACWIFLQKGGVIDAELIQLSREGMISPVCLDLDDFPKIQRVSEIKAEMTRLSRENRVLKDRLEPRYDPFIGGCRDILKVKDQIRIFSDKDIPVFIRGESGTGKELVADAIHNKSARKERTMIRVSCGAISPELFESEFFGHKKGSFTGAISDKPGFFTLGHRGTVFLDEIADLPQFMQAKLLRVLENGTFIPLGGLREEKSDVRIISASNRDLRKMVRDGSFREDLFYRLVHTEIVIPPLRDRGNDSVLIAQHVVEQLNRKYDKTKVLDKSAADLILTYRWPGNIRQLKNCLETAFLLSEDRVTAKDISLIDAESLTYHILIPDEGIDLDNEIIPKYYEAALKKTGGNRAKASKLLKINSPTFCARLKKLGK